MLNHDIFDNSRFEDTVSLCGKYGLFPDLDGCTNPDLSIVYNVNVGHAAPRCIIPFRADVEINLDEQVICFRDEIFGLLLWNGLDEEE